MKKKDIKQKSNRGSVKGANGYKSERYDMNVVMGPSSAQFMDHVIGAFLQIKCQCSQCSQPIWLSHTYLQEIETGSFYWRFCCTEKNRQWRPWKKSHGLHQEPHSSEPFPTRIGHAEHPWNVKGTIKMKSNEFLCASFEILSHRFDDCCVMCVIFCACFFYLCHRLCESGFRGGRRFSSWLDGDVISCGRFHFFSIPVRTKQRCFIEKVGAQTPTYCLFF